jgi:hypothetical protein
LIIGQIVKVLAKGAKFEHQLVALIHDIDICNKHVFDRIEILRNKATARTDAGVRRLDARLSQHDLTLTTIEDGQKTIYTLVKGFIADLLQSASCSCFRLRIPPGGESADKV